MSIIRRQPTMVAVRSPSVMATPNCANGKVAALLRLHSNSRRQIAHSIWLISSGSLRCPQRKLDKARPVPLGTPKMKTLIVLPALVSALLLGAAGCSKSEKPPPAPQIGGVTVDLPKLNAAFENSSQELKTTATQVGFN